MKTSLEHLPDRKREQITAIADVIQSRAPVELIILFGSYARGDWVEDLAGGYFSDFDLMVVVASASVANDDELWSNITAEVRPYGGRTPVTMVVHELNQVNHEIKSGQYFYTDVVNDGVVLYNKNDIKLARPKTLTAEERYERALSNFEHWFGSASDFWRGSVLYASRGLDCPAAFLLHQAAERYFAAIQLVFTGYKPKSHDLEMHATKTASIHPLMEAAFPRTEPTDKHHFRLLKRAYIEARYSKSYHVTMAEFQAMRDSVRDQAERVRAACTEKLHALSPTGATPTLHPVPGPGDKIEVPKLPDLTDPHAVEIWRDALIEATATRAHQEGLRVGEERGIRVGEERGREEGLRAGEERGIRVGEERGIERGRVEGLRVGEERGRDEGRHEELARRVVEVLRRRGIEVSDEQERRITACRDEATLITWWERAWVVTDVGEI